MQTYIYKNKEPFIIKNKKGVELKIQDNTIWEKQSNEIICLHLKDENKIIKLNPETFKKFFEKSYLDLTEKVQPEIIAPDEVYSEIPNDKDWDKFFDKVEGYLTRLCERLNKIDAAANYQEINDVLQIVMQQIKNVEKFTAKDFDLKEPLSQQAFIFFSSPVLNIIGKNKNYKSKKEPMVYTQALEKEAMNWLKDGLRWLKDNPAVGDRDIGMVDCHISDYLDILKIAFYTNQGDAVKAEKVSHLDTIIREGLPEDYWENICQKSEEELKKISIPAIALIEKKKLKKLIDTDKVSTPVLKL